MTTDNNGMNGIIKPKILPLFWYKKNTRVVLIVLCFLVVAMFPVNLLVWPIAIYLLVHTTAKKILLVGQYYESMNDYVHAADFYSLLPDNPDAQYRLGMIYSDSGNPCCNLETALRYFEQAALCGKAEYIIKIAWMYYNGEGCVKDIKKSFRMFQQCADRGYKDAILQTALMLEAGEGTEINYGKAISYLQRLKDDPEAQVKIARLNQLCNTELKEAESLFASGDYAQAFDIYLEAYKAGNMQAACRIGKIYLEGLGVAASKEDAEKFLKIAADNNNADALEMLGNMYWAENESKGVKYLVKAFAAGKKHLAKQLGMYYYDWKREDSDDKLAYKYLQVAVDSGDNSVLYECGEVAEALAKHEEAVKYYELATEYGRKEAFLSLGRLYYQSNRIPHDLKKAMEYLNKALDKGCDKAVLDLGNVCAESNKKEDHFKAVDFYRQALQKEIEGADKALEKEMQNLRNRNWAVELFNQWCESSEFTGLLKSKQGLEFIEQMLLSAIPGEPSMKSIARVKQTLQHGFTKDLAEDLIKDTFKFLRDIGGHESEAQRQRREQAEMLEEDRLNNLRNTDTNLILPILEAAIKFPAFLKSKGRYSERFIKACSDDKVIFPFIIYSFAINHLQLARDVMNRDICQEFYPGCYFRLLLPIVCLMEGIRNPFSIETSTPDQVQIMMRMLVDNNYVKANYSRIPAEIKTVLESQTYQYLSLTANALIKSDGVMFSTLNVSKAIINRNHKSYEGNPNGIDLNLLHNLYPKLDEDMKAFLTTLS